MSQTKAVRNINDQLGSYYVIFEIREAVQPGRQKQDLTIVVENAYRYDPEQANPVLSYWPKWDF
ncbi:MULTISPECIES: hypothetical protein [Pseudomonas syringae group]|uniref:hypothetical protein n=1 Tax=Pseudomonas syringae group TaxID=136849 RepID=UPI0011C3F77D|nr:hypothetical protein [Pseudomonas coronafaciens]